tara:strand:- start:702 stop:1553 length:852 start_codon:yes stop_codon:yes gene_type:complete
MNIQRPLLRYHGGKWLLAPWIIGYFPKHRIYVEPFGGAASVLLRKAPSYAEIYNDLDDDVVNLFRVLRSPDAEKLIAALRLTPFSRTEFAASYEYSIDPIERARNLIIRSFMGFGSDGHNGARPTGFRANSNRSGSTPAHDWCNYPESLIAIVERVQSNGVVIENRHAHMVMETHDSETTLHYVDPPYLHTTRTKSKNSVNKNYRHELSEADHDALLVLLRKLSGMVILSGYPNDKYDRGLSGWQKVERKAFADGARERIECLWLNPACQRAASAGPLFGTAA